MNNDNTTLFVFFRITSLEASVFYHIVETTNTYYINELKSNYENKRHLLSRYFNNMVSMTQLLICSKKQIFQTYLIKRKYYD